MKVLLAIDCSPSSHDVLDCVLHRPWPAATNFCVISVVDLSEWEGLPALVEDAKLQAKSWVKLAADKLIKAGYRPLSEIVLGYPKHTIAEYAKQWGADLIMVGSHGHKALRRFFLGSVAQAVLRSAPCSVEIVRPRLSSSTPRDEMKILLATDGSQGAAKAVYSVANRPWPAKTQVKILSVVQLLSPEGPAVSSPLCAEYPTSLIEQVWKEARTRAAETVGHARNVLQKHSLQLYDGNATPVGEARGSILDDAEAWGADLIVVGSGGLHGFDRVMLGSVSEAVALHAHCSVEVIRG